MEIRTNRDLYGAIARLLQEQQPISRTLEGYLRALWPLASEHQALSGFSVAVFYDLLSRAFSADGPPFDESWRQRYDEVPDANEDYAGWQATILRQIVDLREMEEQGMLDNELRYLGINSPRGARWYNFDIATYLECAMAGSYGGWSPGDKTGRIFVPGKVAVLHNGKLEEREPAEIPNPVLVIRNVGWGDFRYFLCMGQGYE